MNNYSPTWYTLAVKAAALMPTTEVRSAAAVINFEPLWGAPALKAGATLTALTVARSAVACKIITPLSVVEGVGVGIIGGDCNHAVIVIDDFVYGRSDDGGTHSRGSAIQANIVATSAVR
jgi:hypothetical protein